MSNQDYSVFNTETRKIERAISCAPSEIALNVMQGEDYISGIYDDVEYYVDATKTPQLRQDFTLEALPLPCTVTIEGVEYPVTEQPTFEFDAPGTYAIEVDAGAEYMDKVFHVSN